jgi:hypothetical protein
LSLKITPKRPFVVTNSILANSLLYAFSSPIMEHP